MIENITFIFVFIEGVISFFSPCVIPLIPIYIGYLAGNPEISKENTTIKYQRKNVLLHTIFFVFGISFAFFILGMSFTTLGTFFQSNKLLFTRIGGIIIIILGLFQIGIFEFKFLKHELKYNIDLSKVKINPFIAFIMGFTFSFAWTPCVGPALSSVLILASSSNNAYVGNLLVLIYTLGFVIPFLLIGLFTTQVLNFIKTNQKLLKYTVKTGGILLIIIGIMTFTGWMNGISSYLNSFDQSIQSENNELVGQAEETDEEDTSEDSTESEKFPAIDFTLIDQYGNEHTLSDYKGKVVFLNFWATWCPPCKKEMPHIEEIFNQYNKNNSDVIILGVANPKTDKYPYNQDVNKDEIIQFLKQNGYSFPTVFDETGRIFSQYNITAFPTTFMIDKQGNISGYAPGMLTKDIMNSIIQQTLDLSD
ncbi:MAG: cytochrome c biogenesis protein CcdA [Eubacteriaceae bacterium]